MKSNSQARRVVAVLLIICISIGGGILINEAWNAIDKRLHPKEYSEIIAEVSNKVLRQRENCYCVITIDRE